MTDTAGWFVSGVPRPKARPRVVNGHAYTPERTRVWERTVALSYDGPLYEGAVKVRAEFRLPNRRRVDIDNLLKALLDALNERAYHDDGQVTVVEMAKVIEPKRPGVWFDVEGSLCQT